LVMKYNHRVFNRKNMLEFLDKLEENTGTGSLTFYIPPRSKHTEVVKSLRELSMPVDKISEITGITDNSHTGGVIFWSDEKIYVVLSPFPITERALIPGFSTGILSSLLQKDYTIGLVLVRLGAYAVGICKGEKLVSSKVGTGNIHARHRQGGSSAHRFERHREKQIEYFFTRVCQHAREHLEPRVKELDYLVYGGARTTILELQKQCDFLGKLKATHLLSLLDITKPKLDVLKNAVHRVWSTTVYEWYEEN
jgi:peptide subunit release factor 1 (eRF1)